MDKLLGNGSALSAGLLDTDHLCRTRVSLVSPGSPPIQDCIESAILPNPDLWDDFECIRIRMIWMRRNRRQYVRVREHARALVHTRIGHFNGIYGFKLGRVFIKNHKSRWGSCSKKGNLNFNYKILFLPTDIADYIIVHELCHLAELSLSPRFWGLVVRTIPDHKRRRRHLRLIERNHHIVSLK